MRAFLLPLLLAVLLASCSNLLLVQRYESVNLNETDHPVEVLKLKRFRTFKMLKKVGSNSVLIAGKWKRENGQLVLKRKRQRGFDPLPSRWVTVKDNTWAIYHIAGDSLRGTNGNRLLLPAAND